MEFWREGGEKYVVRYTVDCRVLCTLIDYSVMDLYGTRIVHILYHIWVPFALGVGVLWLVHMFIKAP